jgi:hypothetical protein
VDKSLKNKIIQVETIKLEHERIEKSFQNDSFWTKITVDKIKTQKQQKQNSKTKPLNLNDSNTNSILQIELQNLIENKVNNINNNNGNTTEIKTEDKNTKLKQFSI